MEVEEFAPGFSFISEPVGTSTVCSEDAGRLGEAIEKCRQKYLPSLPQISADGSRDEAVDDDAGDDHKVGSADESADESSPAVRFEDSPISPLASFEDMQLSPVLMRAIASLGFSTPTPIQSIAVPVGLTGRDICGAAETGSGKTAAFLIPCIERLLHKTSRVPFCRVAILLPTRELALQCHDVACRLLRFSKAAVRAVALVGGEPIAEQRSELMRLRPDIVIATPGRLIDHLHNTTAHFSLDSISVLVLDEADRMLEEGFEDELTEIVKNCPRSRQTLLFSATMTDRIEALVRLSLNRPVRLFVDTPGSLNKNLQQFFVKVKREQDRLALLLACAHHQLACNPAHRMVIFVPTKELCHRLCMLWRLASLPCVCSELHGGLGQAERNANLDAFRAGRARVLLATDVAARGLDIPDITLVLNYSLPPAFPQYCHRVGRTARAGRAGTAVSLVGESERKLMRSIIKHSASAHRPSARSIAPSLVAWYRGFLDESKADLAEILQVEKEEMELARAEADLRRAEELLRSKQISRGTGRARDSPIQPTWFQSSTKKKRDRPQSQGKGGILTAKGKKRREDVSRARTKSAIKTRAKKTQKK